MPGMTKEALTEEMLAAAQTIFKEQWPFIAAFATPEFEKLAVTILQIRELTESTAMGTRNTGEAIGRLAQLAEQLRDSVAGFKLPHDA